MADEFNLDSVFSASAPNSSTDPSIGSGSSSTGLSLDNLFGSAIKTVADGAAGGITNAISNATRSSNTQPVPDLTAKAATPGTGFINSKIAGISAPILIGGVVVGAVVLFLMLKRK